MDNRERLKHELREDEGFRATTYPGPLTGLPHIGFGHLLGQEQTDEELAAMGLDDELDDWKGFTITQAQAEKLLDIDVNDAIKSLAPTWTPEELEMLDPERFIALMSMAFQVGGHGVQYKFPSFVKAVKAEDWDRAADEMEWSNGLKKQRRSAWYKQTPDRCADMANKMRGKTPIEMHTEGGEDIHRETHDETAQTILAELLPVIHDIQTDIQTIKTELEQKGRKPSRS